MGGGHARGWAGDGDAGNPGPPKRPKSKKTTKNQSQSQKAKGKGTPLHARRASAVADMAWGGASSKGRSSCPSLNYLCRKKAAYCIAKGIRLELPWVQSGAMPADGLSRL